MSLPSKQTLHHAAVLSSRNSRHGVYTLFVEANMTTVLRVVLICFSYRVIDDYLQCARQVANNHLKWIYEDECIRELSHQELGEVGEMHTLRQNLSLWREASLECFEEDRTFGHIGKIIPSIIAYWNFTKGGVDSGLSRYLARAHSSPFSVNSLETILWDRLIMTALLSCFSLYKYDTLDIDFIENANFQQIKIKSQQNMNTFDHFLSEAIRWSSQKAFEWMSQRVRDSLGLHVEPVLPEPVQYTDLSGMTNNEILAYYKGPEGTRRRCDRASEHIKMKTKFGVCSLCKYGRTALICQQCQVYLCTKQMENHVHHPKHSDIEYGNYYHSCYEIFHSEGCVFR